MDGENTNMNSEAITQHLLFHKALIDDREGSDRIDRYMSILENDTEGEKLPDPEEESIRSVFSLVLEHGLDPWEIDIREFARLYREKVKNDMFDMIVAGKLVLMAWKVLRMQSDATVASGETPIYEEDIEIYEVGGNIVTDPDPEPLHIPVIKFREAQYRSSVRPVTMIELLNAFEEAREQASIAQERERVRQELRAKAPKKFENKAHDEDDEKDIVRVWDMIQKLGTGTIPLSDLLTDDRMENITRFVAVLHLVRDGKINIWQEELPYGAIYIEIKMDWATGSIETLPQDGIVTPRAVM